jgi:hypothetical protein
MFKLARWVGSAFVTLIAAYVFFFVPIGRRTLYDHARRIATTPEAREFGDEMRTAGARVAERTRDEVEGVIRHGVLPQDAGVRERAANEPPSPPPPHLERSSPSSPQALTERVEPPSLDGGASLPARSSARALRRASR